VLEEKDEVQMPSVPADSAHSLALLPIFMHLQFYTSFLQKRLDKTDLP